MPNQRRPALSTTSPLRATAAQSLSPPSRIPFPLWLFRYPIRPSSSSRRVITRYRRHCLFVRFVNLVVTSINALALSFWSGAPNGRPRLFISHFLDRRNSGHFECHGNGVLSHFYSQLLSSCRRVFDADCGSISPVSTPDQPSGSNGSSNPWNITVAEAIRIFMPLLTRAIVTDHPMNPPAPIPPLFSDDGFFNYVNSAPDRHAMPIIPERLSLPQVCGNVDLATILRPEDYEYFAEPANFILTDEEVVERATNGNYPRIRKARVFGSQANFYTAVRRMNDSGMVVYSSDASVVENGLFCVTKPGTTDLRLIVDCRPVNALLREPPKVALPNAGLFPQLVARDKFWIAKSDLSDFYHHIALPPKWIRFFGLPPVMIDGRQAHPQLRSLPMGWSYSVLLAQMAHERIIQRAMWISRIACRPLNQNSMYDDPMITDTPLVGCYIDDVGIIGTDRNKVDQAQRAYIETATEFGFTAKPSKTLPARPSAELLGVVIDGSAKTVSPSTARIMNIISTAVALVKTGRCTYDELTSLVGKFNWIFLLRRPLLSVFNNVYHWISRFEGTQGPLNLWNSCAREIACATALVIFAHADLSLPLASSILASDASSTGYGVTIANGGQRAWDMLCAPLRPPNDETSDDGYSIYFSDYVAPIWEDTEKFHWSTIEAGENRDGGRNHINVDEMNAAVRAAHAACTGTRQLLLTDSAVVYGILCKGRSSSHDLLRRCRRTAAIMVIKGGVIIPKWIPSELNPADAPSRINERRAELNDYDDYEYEY